MGCYESKDGDQSASNKLVKVENMTEPQQNQNAGPGEGLAAYSGVAADVSIQGITAGDEDIPSNARQYSSAKEDLIRLRILHINDVYELENLPRLATCVRDFKARDNEDKCKTIVLLPGDFLAPSLLSSLDHGHGMIDCLNMCGVDYVCFGNHETDVPHAELQKRILESNFKWINTNMQDIALGQEIGKLPTHHVITVASSNGLSSRRVGLLGLCTDDSGLYRPGAFGNATIEAVIPSAEAHLQLFDTAGLDLIVPMTHQSIGKDKEMGEHFKGKFPGGENGNAFPLIIGGHDHEPFNVFAGGANIIKCGCDANFVGVSRVVWPDPDSRVVSVTSETRPISEFVADEGVEAAVHRHMEIVRELDTAPLFAWSAEEHGILSSKDNRIKETTLCTKLVSLLRDALGCDCCVLNAGNIRGSKEYEASYRYFTYNDLKAEIPFDCEMIAIPMPGKVLSDAVAFTREKSFLDPPESFGGYMQIDDGMSFDKESRSLTRCEGKPFDPERIYQVGVLFMVMTGVDNITPLVEYADQNPELFPINKSHEMGRPAKLLLVDYMSKAIWYQLGGFDEIDVDGKGYVTTTDIHKAVEKHFSASVGKIVVNNILASSDMNADGVVSREEMLRATMMSAQARRSMDQDSSGTLDREEVRNFIRRVISKHEEEVQRLVDQVFADHKVNGQGHIERSHVLSFMSSNFKMEAVKVPGQNLERGEITAVNSRLKSKQPSNLSAKSEGDQMTDDAGGDKAVDG